MQPGLDAARAGRRAPVRSIRRSRSTRRSERRPAQAARRNYLQSLHAELSDKGVYVGMLYIGAIIENSAFHTQTQQARVAGRDWGPTVDPAHLADLLWSMHCARGPAETIYPERRVDS